MNLPKMMKQVRDMQKKMQETQDELANLEIEGIAGGGAVKVVSNGQKEIKSVKILKDAIEADIDQESLEMLEDLILSAIKDAQKKSTESAKQKMSSLTGGMDLPGLNIPGLF